MKEKKIKNRINILMEPGLVQAVESEAKKNYLPVSTYIKQLLYRTLQKENNCLTFKSDEE